MDLNEITRWWQDAKSGDRCIYHTGDLGKDRQGPSETHANISAVAAFLMGKRENGEGNATSGIETWTPLGTGECILVQRKISEPKFDKKGALLYHKTFFEYIAVRK